MKEEKYIVYVDDDEDDRFIFAEVFKEVKEYVFQTVESGTALFELLNSKAPETYPCLIICDMNMPQQNGVEVLHQLRRNPAYDTIPMVMFTTSKNPSEEGQCTALGAVVEVKPGDMEELEQVAHQLLKYCRE